MNGLHWLGQKRREKVSLSLLTPLRLSPHLLASPFLSASSLASLPSFAQSFLTSSLSRQNLSLSLSLLCHISFSLSSAISLSLSSSLFLSPCELIAIVRSPRVGQPTAVHVAEMKSGGGNQSVCGGIMPYRRRITILQRVGRRFLVPTSFS